MKFVVTYHAVRRYMERISRAAISYKTAEEHILHAAEIAQLPSAKQMRLIRSKYSKPDQGHRKDRMTGSVLLWCPVECMLLCCQRRDVMVITTVYRVPPDSDIRIKKRGKYADNC